MSDNPIVSEDRPSTTQRPRPRAASVSTSSLRNATSPRKPELPGPPLELFSYQYTLDAAKTGVNSETDLSPIRIKEEWDKLSATGQQYWEAQYGRKMLEYQRECEIWERQYPRLQFAYDPRQGVDLDVDRLNLDVDGLAALWHEFIEKCLQQVFGIQDKGLGSMESRTDHRSPSHSRESPPASKSPTILFRAELYRLRERWSRRDGKKLGATLKKSFEHPKPLLLKLQSESKDESIPIFEITSFLAAPKSKRKGVFARRFLSSSDEDDSLPAAPPEGDIIIRAEAGTILTINSEVIIEAVHAVAPEYPQLVFEGESLIVPEPFCLLLHFRKEILNYRDMLAGTGSLIDKSAAEASVSNTNDSLESAGNIPRESRPEQARHITELYNFLDQRYLDSVLQEHERWAQKPSVCTFEWAWLLFPPRTLVYQRSIANEPIQRASWVKSFKLQGLFNYDRKSRKPIVKPRRLDTRRKLKLKHRLEKIIVVLTNFQNDGRKWKPQEEEVIIWPFNGERLVTDLPVFPASFFDDPEAATRNRIIARGQRYHALASRGQFEYHGETLSGTRRWIHSRIIVDSETYHHDPDLTKRVRSTERHTEEQYYYKKTATARDYSPDDNVVYVRKEIRGRSRSRSSEELDREDLSESEASSEKSLDWNTRIENILGRRRRLSKGTGFPMKMEAPLLLSGDVQTGKMQPSDEFYMICARELNAYIIKERQWVLLDVDHITDCNFNERMIDDLQVSEEIKRLIQALSQTYMTAHNMDGKREESEKKFSGRWSADFVPNKGQGQILLLHGKPGVGKTTTAECVAELTKRPLLTINCGDLGTDAKVVEKELTRWLRLGALWNAVLLLDEADIFLESRERGDLERNSLVSVFLGALEYYQGLLFLTTNRVGVFDEAIVSRVHIILHFPDLTDHERARIWDTSFRKLADERPEFKVDFSLYDYVYRDEAIKALSWNGREIRNAFNTMTALAEWDAWQLNRYGKDGKIELRREHLQQVAKMSGSFKKYMHSLRGLDETNHAKLHGLRDDQFHPDVGD